MRSFLVLVLFFVSLENAKACSNICSFLYSNPKSDWEKHSSIAETGFTVTVTPGSVTGIITARFETFTPHYGKTFDFLRFHNDNITGEPNQSLFFRIYLESNGAISGKRNGARIGKTSLGYQIVKSIQISDLDANFYNIFMGHPGNAESLDYNYGTDANWKTLSDVRLRDTVKIKNGGKCTVYKYISACSDPIPRLCDEQIVTENVTLGSPHTLTCTGSGAPYLDVMWTRYEATDLDWTSTYDNTTADHQITSTVEIDNITLDHLGEWNCTIRNKNFGGNVTKTFVLEYTNPVTLLDSPDLEFYKDNGTGTEFEWTVKGWPLEQVTLDCGNENISVTRNETGYTTFIPPQIEFNITLSNENVINCVLKDGDKVLNTRNITRVGYNCTVGEGGVGKDCEVCESGETSAAGVGVCFSGNSSCTEGDWGIEGTCNPCPDNQTSSLNAVKPQECFTPAPEPTVLPVIPDANLIAPIAGGAGGFVAVLILTSVLCVILRRKKPKEFLVGQPAQPRFTGTAEINTAYSDDPVQRTIPRLPIDLDDSECAYANLNETLTRNNCKSKDKENTSKSQQFSSTDRSFTEMTAMANRPSKVEEDTPYANLDEVKRVHSTDKDEEGEESMLARLERPATVKIVTQSGKMPSNNGGVGLKEEPLYAVIMKEDR